MCLHESMLKHATCRPVDFIFAFCGMSRRVAEKLELQKHEQTDMERNAREVGKYTLYASFIVILMQLTRGNFRCD